jgi:hypothetical protein
MGSDSTRFRKNAPGPFLVRDGECITCRAPEAQASDLMAHDEESGHCYFARQPSTAEETERACRAVWVSCCGAVQYEGSDPKILERISTLHRESGHRAVSRRRRTQSWWRLW